MGILTAGFSWAWGVVKIPLCSWHCSVAAASASCGEHNLMLMAAFFSKAQMKRGCIYEGWPVPLVRCSPLGSTSFNRSVTGVQGPGNTSPRLHFVYLCEISISSQLSSDSWREFPCPTQPPNLRIIILTSSWKKLHHTPHPPWTCSCWMVLCGIVLLNCTLAWYANLYWWTTEEITLETLVIRLLLICGLYYALCIPKGAREILLPSRWDIV